jgi:hypothetical protein
LTGTKARGAKLLRPLVERPDQVAPSTVVPSPERHSLQGATSRDTALLHPLHFTPSMLSPATPTSSNSSAFFGSDDTSFLIALRDTVLPGDINPQESNVEETASRSPPTPSSSSLEPPPCAQPVSNARLFINSDDEQGATSIRTPPDARLHSPLTPSDDDEPPSLHLESPTPARSKYKKRAHSISSDDDYSALVQSPANSQTQTVSSYLDSHTFGASRFGEFGEYMRRKRAKLQIQNTEMGNTREPTTSTSKLFNGLSIHVCQTVPV